MADTIVVLTEEALQPSDADQIVALYEGQDVTFRVFVPEDTERNVVGDFLDYLALGELREALDTALGKQDRGHHGSADAEQHLADSLAALTERDATADGEVIRDDPLPALVNAVVSDKAREIVVVTRPHIVSDAFHRDWASRAREELGVPVLHLYGGTDRLVD